MKPNSQSALLDSPAIAPVGYDEVLSAWLPYRRSIADTRPNVGEVAYLISQLAVVIE